MLDKDLAILYQCKNGTKSINLAVKRNKERFPNDFYFQLTDNEYKVICSRFQFETLNDSKNKRGENLKYLPYVFTEQGVAMLSSVLKTEIACKVSVNIMRAFVSMSHYVSDSLIEQKFINELVLKHDKEIKLLQDTFDKLSENDLKNYIYFDGQIYDSYSKIIDIMNEAKKELIIIDGYADKVLLDMISRLNIKIILITKTKSKLSKLDLEKYNNQYNNLRIVYDDTFHDRYFILDRSVIYHLGTSINYIGSKTFGINKLEDDIVIKTLLEKTINKL